MAWQKYTSVELLGALFSMQSKFAPTLLVAWLVKVACGIKAMGFFFILFMSHQESEQFVLLRPCLK